MNINDLPFSEQAKIPFESTEDMMTAIRDPRYSSPFSDAYNKMVTARIAISTGIGTDSIHVGKVANPVYVGLNDPEAENRAATDKALGALPAEGVTIRNL